MIKSLLRKLGLSPKQAVIVDAVVEEAAEQVGKKAVKAAGKAAKKLV